MVFFRNVGRAITATAVVGALAIALSGCGGGGGPAAGDGGDAASGEPQPGGTAVIASMSEMPGFDPVKLVSLGVGVERAAQVMDTLMYRDDVTGEIKPKLAESLDSDDGQVWTLTLREGVEFTDGTPLDAEAVVFNLDRHIAPDSTSGAKSLLSGVTDIEVTGEYEVTITLNAPSGSFPLALSASSPASLIGSPAALADPEAFNSNPVGAGPFVFDSWTRDSELKLVANEDYYDEGKPYLDALVYRVLPDPQARADALMSGDVVLGQLSGTSWAAAEGNSNLEIVLSAGGGQALIPNQSKEPGSDERVREAIGLATDPKVTNTIVFPGSTLWDQNRDCLPFTTGAPTCLEGASPDPDIEKAKELIADYVADGGSTKVVFSAPASTDETNYYVQQLTEIGLDVDSQISDAATWLQDTQTGNYDVLYGIIASSGYPTQWRYMYSQAFNWGQVADPDLDDALLRARDEVELDDRNAAWQEVSQIVKDTNRLFWTAPYTAATAYATKLHIGTDEFPFKGSLMVYMEDAWLEQ